jgi:hypothetical protein
MTDTESTRILMAPSSARLERMLFWILAVGLVVAGIDAVITHTMGQGNFNFPAAPLRGPIAVLFGSGEIIIGVYFIYLLLAKKPDLSDKKPDSLSQGDDMDAA